MNDTPPNIQLFPVMDFETLSNFMNYQYPKNFNGIYSYVSSLSHKQMSFFHNINNQTNKSGSGKLLGWGSGFEPLPDDIHPPKTQKNNKNHKTKNHTIVEDIKDTNAGSKPPTTEEKKKYKISKKITKI